MPAPRRWRRIATQLVEIVVCLALVYLIGINVFLRTRLFRDVVSSDPDSFLLDYASAYSIIPGYVHVEGLTIRGGGRRVQWILTLDRADVVVRLTDLLHKRFHASRVRADGVTIRTRMKIDPGDATPEVLASLPEINGFADPPYTDIGPEAPPVPDESYHPWSVDLEDVDVAHVREVWIQMGRAESDSRVRGRWLFRPQRWLEVGPATVDVSALDFSYGGRRLAAGVEGAIGATLHPYDPREAGLDVLTHVSTDGHLHGVAFGANTLATFLSSSGVRFAGGDGPFDARVIVDHGAFVRGTRAWSESTRAEADASGLRFESSTRVELGVEDVASFVARAADVRVSADRTSLGRVASVTGTIAGRRLEIAHAFDDATVSVDVGGAETSDLSLFRARFFPTSPVSLASGRITADARMTGSLPERRASLHLDFAARRFSATRESDTLTTDVNGHVEVREAALRTGIVDVSAARVVLDGADATSHGIHFRVPALTLETTRLRITAPRHEVECDATVVGERVAVEWAPGAVLTVPSLTVVGSELVFAPRPTAGRVSIDVPRATVADFHGAARLLDLPSGVDLVGGRVEGRGHVELDLAAASARGHATVVAHRLRGRFGATNLESDLTVELEARRGGGSPSGVVDLSGSTAAVTRGGTGKPDDAWWGTFAVSRAALRTKGVVSFVAEVSGVARDASPASVLVADNTPVPAWAANIFRMTGFRTRGEIRAAPGLIEVRSLVARGEGASVQMEYAKRGGVREGALLLQAGVLEMGYDLTSGAMGPVILTPERWFAAKTATIRAHAPPLP